MLVRKRDGIMRFRLGRAIAFVVYRVVDVVAAFFLIVAVALALFIALVLNGL